MKYREEELILIWLNSIVGLDNKQKNFIYEIVKGSAKISQTLTENIAEIKQKLGEEKAQILIDSANGDYLKKAISAIEEVGAIAVTKESDDYPEKLNELEEPPLCLYAKGDVNLLNNENTLAIVGSRKTLPFALSACAEFVEEFSRAGLTLVTGIAEGVDVTVVKTALKAGGKIISVLTGGIDEIYPKAHTEIAGEVAKKGLIITEQPPRLKPQPFMFPYRNRIIAALGNGALIVSAGEKSGALYTAEYAKTLGKKVYAMPYSVGVPSGKGCNALIKQGATLVDEPGAVLKDFNLVAKKKIAVALTDDEKAVITAIKNGNGHIEKIAVATKRQAFTLFPVLSMLEIKGLIVKNGVNVYGLTLNGLEE